MEKNKLLKNRDDRIVDIVSIILTGAFFLVITLPLIYVVSASFSDPSEVLAGRVYFWPRSFTLEGYMKIFDYEPIWIGYKNTIIYTLLGTAINLIVTLPCAYALSRKDLAGRNFFVFLFIFTMFFQGGLIPQYLVIRELGILNSIWAMVLPRACSMWNVIIARTYFQTSIPDELREAAVLDGCTNLKMFLIIVLPLAKPIIIVLAMFYSVEHWNTFFHGLIFMSDTSKMPLQIFLRNILLMDQMVDLLGLDSESSAYIMFLVRLKESMKYGIIVVSTLPLLILSSSMQKFFVKGMMIGALKG